MVAVDPRWDWQGFRVYAPEECKPDGYPVAWSRPTIIGAASSDLDTPPIKDLVRELTGHRCIRCLHPYVVGESSVMADAPHREAFVEATLQLWEEEGAPDAEQLEDGFDAATGARPILYSACDEQCQHGGPWRLTPPAVAHPGVLADERYMRDYSRRNPGGVQAAFRILTVHHLTGEKADCRWWNLTALCQRCHLSVQTRVQMDHPWPWEHSEWFKPYVAGYYAWKYEGRSITRAEAEADMERLLDLERGRYELRGERGTKGVRG